METTIVNGRKIAKDVFEEIAKDEKNVVENGVNPTVSFVQVGQEPSTLSYIVSLDFKQSRAGQSARRRPGCGFWCCA